MSEKQIISYLNLKKNNIKNQFVKLKLIPIFKTNVFVLYVHRQVKTVSQLCIYSCVRPQLKQFYEPF